MSDAKNLQLVSVENYLTDELNATVKHEYVGGRVYEMLEMRNRHHRIASNALGEIGSRLRGKRCQPFNSDTKIRVQLPTQTRFYYPDVSVVCHSNAPHETFQDEPVVIIEVLSRSTRRFDEGEKKDAYLTIPSLAVYLLVEQESGAVVAFRRTAQGFVREVYQGLEAIIPLAEIETELPLAELYERVEFSAEQEPH